MTPAVVVRAGDRLRSIVQRALLLLLTGVFLAAAVTTSAGYVRWLRGDHFFPTMPEERAGRYLAGPVAAWLPHVLSATPRRADLIYVPFADDLEDRDWTAIYYLYPRRLHVRAPGFPSRAPRVPHDLDAGRTRVLDRGRLLTLPGGRPVPAGDGVPVSFQPPAPSWRAGLAWLLTLVAALGWGGLVLRLLDPPLGTGPGRASLRLGLALTTGLGGLGTIGFFAALAGQAGGRPLVLGSTLAGLLAFVPSVRWLRAVARRGAGAAGAGQTPGASERAGGRRPVARLIRAALVAWLAVAVAAPLLRAVSEPMLHWDERFQWAYKGKLLLEEGGIGGPSFQEPDRPHLHRRYPLLVPALEAHVARLAGGFRQERAIKAVFPLFLLAMLLVVHGAARRHLPAIPALLVTGALSALPPLHHATRLQGGPAHTGFADLPLAAFLAAAVAALALWLETARHRPVRSQATAGSSPPHRLALLAALAAGFVFLTKPEGIACAVAVLAVIAIGSVARPAEAARTRLALPGAAIILFLVIAAPRLLLEFTVPAAGTVGYTGDEDYLARLTVPDLLQGLRYNLLPALVALISAPFSPRWCGFGWLPLLGLLSMPLGLGRRSHLLALVLIGPLAADLLAFTLTGSEIRWHLAVALDRLWMQVLAPVFLIIAAQIAQLDTGRRDG